MLTPQRAVCHKSRPPSLSTRKSDQSQSDGRRSRQYVSLRTEGWEEEGRSVRSTRQLISVNGPNPTCIAQQGYIRRLVYDRPRLALCRGRFDGDSEEYKSS
jgi:hypothetical protein